MSTKKKTSLIETNEMVKPIYENVVTLSGDNEKKLKLVGVAIVCDRPGINGRSYPSSILKREMNRYITKFINGGRSFSELNHPRLTADGEGRDYSVFEINLMKACCMIETLSFEGSDMMCKMKVVDKHPAGQALKALVDDGLRPGYSLRGAGSVTDSGKGYYEVADDYRMITIDVVGNPSFDDDAIISSLYESMNKGNIKVLTESANYELEMASKEFIHNIGIAAKENILTNRRQFNKVALESYCRSLVNIGDIQ